MATFEVEKKSFRERLNAVSPSYCLAKWLQVTMHLHSGHNHSCHHPNTHRTPLAELKNDPSALHNTEFKKDLREKMLKGERPSECQYCWNIEDMGSDYFSDRTLKSSEFWAAPQLEKIAKSSGRENINPTYVEVSFSNVCNFRCSYCSANFSTRWANDIATNGPYTTYSGSQSMDILPEDDNPYIKAFWDWWPSLVQDLKVFRVTGGEPLMSKNTFRILEDLCQNPRPHMEIAINTNLGVSDAIFDKFIALAKDLVSNKKVKLFRMYTSVDGYGSRAEYIRNGLEFPRFQKNLERFMSEVPGGQSIIMATFNALSLTSFKDLLVYVHESKKKYTVDPNVSPLFIDISYLRNPSYQTVQILPQSYLHHMDEIHDYMMTHAFSNNNPGAFYFFETAKVQRIVEWMKQPLDEKDLARQRKDFYTFFSEHDTRRNTSFLNTFPEMKEFWELCQKS